MIIANNKTLITEELRVPARFLNHPPRPEKWQRAEEKWKETGELGKVYVDRNGWIVDGYISYLIALHNGIKRIRGVVLKTQTYRPTTGAVRETKPTAPQEQETPRKPQPYGLRIGRLHLTWEARG